MNSEIAPDAQAVSTRESVRSVWIVIHGRRHLDNMDRYLGSNWITLWYLYGCATVAHDHLRITRTKPQLVVSNGDVLHGIGFYDYLVGVAIWLPLAVGSMLLIYYNVTA